MFETFIDVLLIAALGAVIGNQILIKKRLNALKASLEEAAPVLDAFSKAVDESKLNLERINETAVSVSERISDDAQTAQTALEKIKSIQKGPTTKLGSSLRGTPKDEMIRSAYQTASAKG